MSLTEREIRTIVDRITAELDRGRRAAPGDGADGSALTPTPAPRPHGDLDGHFPIVAE